MLQIRVGVQLASLRLPLKQGLLTVARMGAEGVEIDGRNELKAGELSRTGVRQVRKMLEDLNLRVGAVTYRTRRGYDVADDLDRRVSATQEALKLAYELGSNVVVNHIGRVPEKGTPAWSTMVEALTDIGRYSQRVGATLAAETGTEGGAELAGLIAALPPGSLGVDFHPANLIIHGHSPAETAAALAEHVVHVHATDATRDLAHGRGIEVQLGRGLAEFPEILGLLEEHQYRGFITIERRQSENAVAEITDAVKYLKSL